MRLVVHELEKEDLIYKHADLRSPSGYSSIGPKRYFFCRTDAIFQSWNPADDAREVVKFLLNVGQEAVSIAKLDAELVWGPRRLNPALAFLYL